MIISALQNVPDAGSTNFAALGKTIYLFKMIHVVMPMGENPLKANYVKVAGLMNFILFYYYYFSTIFAMHTSTSRWRKCTICWFFNSHTISQEEEK